MDVTLIVACVVLGIFIVILLILAMTRTTSTTDTATLEVVRRRLTGPVPTQPRHARLEDPNREAD